MPELSTEKTKLIIKDVIYIAGIAFSIGFSKSELENVKETLGRHERQIEKIEEVQYNFVEKVYEILSKKND